MNLDHINNLDSIEIHNTSINKPNLYNFNMKAYQSGINFRYYFLI